MLLRHARSLREGDICMVDSMVVFPKPSELLVIDDYMGAGLVARRVSVGLTRMELASLAGISYNALKRYESGQPASLENFVMVENALRARVRRLNGWPTYEGEVLGRSRNQWPIPFELEYISEGLYFGEGLIRRREAVGIDRRELADLAMISIDNVRRYENGLMKPKTPHIVSLENALRLGAKYKSKW